MTRAFDPGNLTFYENVGEHVTKQAQKGSIEDKTKKLMREQMQHPTKQVRRRKGR